MNRKQESSSHHQQKVKETPHPAGFIVDHDGCNDSNHHTCNDHDMTLDDDFTLQEFQKNKITQNSNSCSSSTTLSGSSFLSGGEINSESREQQLLSLIPPSLNGYKEEEYEKEKREETQIVTRFKQTNNDPFRMNNESRRVNPLLLSSKSEENKSNVECNKLAQSSCSSSHDQVTKIEEKVGMEGERIFVTECKMNPRRRWEEGGSANEVLEKQLQSNVDSFTQPLKSIRITVLNQEKDQFPHPSEKNKFSDNTKLLSRKMNGREETEESEDLVRKSSEKEEGKRGKEERNRGKEERKREEERKRGKEERKGGKEERKKEEERAPLLTSSSSLFTCSHNCFSAEQHEVSNGNTQQPTSVSSTITVYIEPKWPPLQENPSMSIHQHPPSSSRAKDLMKNDIKMSERNESQLESKIPSSLGVNLPHPPHFQDDGNPSTQGRLGEKVYQITRINIDGSSSSALNQVEKFHVSQFRKPNPELKSRCGVQSDDDDLYFNTKTSLQCKSSPNHQQQPVEVTRDTQSGHFISSVTSFIQHPELYSKLEQTKEHTTSSPLYHKSLAIGSRLKDQVSKKEQECGIVQEPNHADSVPNERLKNEAGVSSSNSHSHSSISSPDDPLGERRWKITLQEEKGRLDNEGGRERKEDESEFEIPASSFHSQFVTTTKLDERNCHLKEQVDVNQGVVSTSALSGVGLSQTSNSNTTSSPPSTTPVTARGSCCIKTCGLNNSQQQASDSSFGNKQSTQLFLNPKAALNGFPTSLNEVTDHGFGSLKSCSTGRGLTSCSVTSHSQQVSNTDETSNNQIPSLCHRNLSLTDSSSIPPTAIITNSTSSSFPAHSASPAKRFIRSFSSPPSSLYPVHPHSPSSLADQPQYNHNNSTTITATNLLTIQSPGDLSELTALSPTTKTIENSDHIPASRHGQQHQVLPPALHEDRVHSLNPSHDHLDPSQSHRSASTSLCKGTREVKREDSSRSTLRTEEEDAFTPADDHSITLEQYYEHSLSYVDHDGDMNVKANEVLKSSLRKPSEGSSQSRSGNESFHLAQTSNPSSLEPNSVPHSSRQLREHEEEIDFDPFFEPDDVEVTADFSDDDFHESNHQNFMSNHQNFMSNQSQVIMYSNYNNPVSYSLHTIAEESCEESDRETTPVNSIEFRVKSSNDSRFSRPDSYDPSLYQPKTCVTIDSRHSSARRNDLEDDNRSGSETEKSGSGEEECDALSDIEVDPSSSRLEQYFMSELLDPTPIDGPSSLRERNFSHHHVPYERDHLHGGVNQQTRKHEPNKAESFSQKIQPSSPVSSQSSSFLLNHSSHEKRKESERKNEIVDRTSEKDTVAKDTVAKDELRGSKDERFNRNVTKVTVTDDPPILLPQAATESSVDDDESNNCDERVKSDLINSSPSKNAATCNTGVNNDDTRKDRKIPSSSEEESELVQLMTKFLAQVTCFKESGDNPSERNNPTISSALTPSSPRFFVSPSGSSHKDDSSESSSSILRDFEVQLSLLMKNNISSYGSTSVTSPGGSSATLGSNNSDYGSDTLESGDCSSEDDGERSKKGKNSSTKGREDRDRSSSKRNTTRDKLNESEEQEERIKRRRKERELFTLFQKILERASSSSNPWEDSATFDTISSTKTKEIDGERRRDSLAHQIVSFMHQHSTPVSTFLVPSLVTKSYNSNQDQRSVELEMKDEKQSPFPIHEPKTSIQEEMTRIFPIHEPRASIQEEMTRIHEKETIRMHGKGTKGEQLMHSGLSVTSPPSHPPSSQSLLDHCSRNKREHSLLIPKSSFNSDSGSEATISASVSIAELEEREEIEEEELEEREEIEEEELEEREEIEEEELEEREEIEEEELDDHINESEQVPLVSREMEHLFSINSETLEETKSETREAKRRQTNENLDTNVSTFQSKLDSLQTRSDYSDSNHDLDTNQDENNVTPRGSTVESKVDDEVRHSNDSFDTVRPNLNGSTRIATTSTSASSQRMKGNGRLEEGEKNSEGKQGEMKTDNQLPIERNHRASSEGNLFSEEAVEPKKSHNNLYDKNKTHHSKEISPSCNSSHEENVPRQEEKPNERMKGESTIKSVGDTSVILDPRKGHILGRDTGYYSFKSSSQESVKSVHGIEDNKGTKPLLTCHQSATLPSPRKKKPASSLIPEDEGGEKYIKIPRKFISSTTNPSSKDRESETTATSSSNRSDPHPQSSIRSPPPSSSTHSTTRPSFLTTSGVLKKLTAFRGMFLLV